MSSSTGCSRRRASLLPPSVTNAARLTLAEAIGPLSVAASAQPLPSDDLSRQALLARCVRLESELARWRPPVRSLPPLVGVDLVDARVILTGQDETDETELATTLGPTSSGQWVVGRSQPHIDRGLPYQLAADDWLTDGRTLVGRITRSGRLSSAIETLTDETFRQPVQLVTPGGRLVPDGRGVLAGLGDACELRHVRAEVPVAVGQWLLTPAATGPVLIAGRITQATLEPGAAHWQIVVQTAPPVQLGQTLTVLTRRAMLASESSSLGASPLGASP